MIFKLELDMKAACDGDEMIITFRNNTGISSPNYPENYGNNLYCKWHIKADAGYQIELEIKGGELEEKYVNKYHTE